MDVLSEKIRYVRRIKGWSQENLARKLGVTLNTVQRWEMGKTKPSPLAREKLQGIFREVLDGDQLNLF